MRFAKEQQLRSFSLVCRIILGVLICVHKIMHSRLDFPCDVAFVAPTRFGLPGHSFKIQKQRFKTRRRKHAFSYRVFPYWNRSPAEIAYASSVEIFKLRPEVSQKSPSNPSSRRLKSTQQVQKFVFIPPLNLTTPHD